MLTLLCKSLNISIKWIHTDALFLAARHGECHASVQLIAAIQRSRIRSRFYHYSMVAYCAYPTLSHQIVWSASDEMPRIENRHGSCLRCPRLLPPTSDSHRVTSLRFGPHGSALAQAAMRPHKEAAHETAQGSSPRPGSLFGQLARATAPVSELGCAGGVLKCSPDASI